MHTNAQSKRPGPSPIIFVPFLSQLSKTLVGLTGLRQGKDRAGEGILLVAGLERGVAVPEVLQVAVYQPLRGVIASVFATFLPRARGLLWRCEISQHGA